MELIKNVVREIAIIVLLASFLEMLLPKSNMKRFVQVILGLFILISILQPIASLVSSDELSFQIEAWKYQPQANYDFDEIIAQGQQISQVRENMALRDYEARIEKQIIAMVQLVPGVDYTEVSVRAGTGKNAPLGEIEQVVINIFDAPPTEKHSANLEIRRINEVVINIKEPVIIYEEETDSVVDFPQDQRVNEVTNLISNFYSLPISKIKVEVQN